MRETLTISLDQEFGELEKKILPRSHWRQDFFIANDNFRHNFIISNDNSSFGASLWDASSLGYVFTERASHWDATQLRPANPVGIYYR